MNGWWSWELWVAISPFPHSKTEDLHWSCLPTIGWNNIGLPIDWCWFLKVWIGYHRDITYDCSRSESRVCPESDGKLRTTRAVPRTCHDMMIKPSKIISDICGYMYLDVSCVVSDASYFLPPLNHIFTEQGLCQSCSWLLYNHVPSLLVSSQERIAADEYHQMEPRCSLAHRHWAQR